MTVQVVLECQNGWLTLVKVKGMFRAKGVTEVATSKVDSDEEHEDLLAGTLATRRMPEEVATNLARSTGTLDRMVDSPPTTKNALTKEAAKWVARTFNFGRSSNASLSDREIVEIMLQLRYAQGFNPTEDARLLSFVSAEVEKDPSLNGLLVAVLSGEGVFRPDDADAIARAEAQLKSFADTYDINSQLTRLEN